MPQVTKEFTVVLDYEAIPYDPGVMSGPPENCYPPEGGPESNSITINGKEVDINKWTALESLMLEAANEQMENDARDSEEARGDYLYEQQRDKDLDAL